MRRRAPGPAAGSSILTMNGNQRRTATDRGLHRAHLHLFLPPLLLIFWPFARPSSPSCHPSLSLSLPPPSISPCCGFLFEKNYNQLFKTALSHANLLHLFWLRCPKKCSIVFFCFFSLLDKFCILRPRFALCPLVQTQICFFLFILRVKGGTGSWSDGSKCRLLVSDLVILFYEFFIINTWSKSSAFKNVCCRYLLEGAATMRWKKKISNLIHLEKLKNEAFTDV